MSKKIYISLFAVILTAFLLWMIVDVYQDSNKIENKAANEHAAQKWCDSLKVNCSAISCPSTHIFQVCSVSYNNGNIAVLDCSPEYCTTKSLSK